MIDIARGILKMARMSKKNGARKRLACVRFGDRLAAILAQENLDEVEAAESVGIRRDKLSKWKETDPDKMIPNVYFDEAWVLAEYISRKSGLPMSAILLYIGNQNIDPSCPIKLTPEEQSQLDGIKRTALDRLIQEGSTPAAVLDHVRARESKQRRPKKSPRHSKGQNKPR